MVAFKFNSLALNNCFNYIYIFQNGFNALSKIILKRPGLLFLLLFLFLFLFLFFFFCFVFLSKSSKFCVVWTIRFCSNFTNMWYKHFLRNVTWRDFSLSVSVLTMVARKSFNGKVRPTAKIDFLMGHNYYVTVADAEIGSLKSLHRPTLFDKYSDHMVVKFEQNRMVRTPNYAKF